MQQAIANEKKVTQQPPLVRQPITNELASVVSLAHQIIRDNDPKSIFTQIPTASLRLIIGTFLALANNKQMERPWVQNYEKELRNVKMEVKEDYGPSQG